MSTSTPPSTSTKQHAALDHICVATENLEHIAPLYVNMLGGKNWIGGSRNDFRGAEWKFVNDARLESISPSGDVEKSFVHKFIAKRGPSIHHITFTVPDIHLARRRAEDVFGLKVIDFDDSVPEWKEFFVSPKEAHGIVVQIAEVHHPMPYWNNQFDFPNVEKPPPPSTEPASSSSSQNNATSPPREDDDPRRPRPRTPAPVAHPPYTIEGLKMAYNPQKTDERSLRRFWLEFLGAETLSRSVARNQRQVTFRYRDSPMRVTFNATSNVERGGPAGIDISHHSNHRIDLKALNSVANVNVRFIQVRSLAEDEEDRRRSESRRRATEDEGVLARGWSSIREMFSR